MKDRLKPYEEDINFITFNLGTTTDFVKTIYTKLLKLNDWEIEYQESEQEFLNAIKSNRIFKDHKNGLMTYVIDKEDEKYEIIKRHLNLEDLIKKCTDKTVTPYFNQKSGLKNYKEITIGDETKLICTFDTETLLDNFNQKPLKR